MSNNNNISGLILAAGKGTRLRPATLTRPKALIPFCGVTLLELAISRLAAMSLNNITVNACFMGNQIEEYVAKIGQKYNLPLTVSLEPTLFGTGGGIRKVLSLPGVKNNVLVHNADVILDDDFQRLIDIHIEKSPLATLLLVPGRGPCTIGMNSDDHVTDMVMTPGTGGYTFSGVYIISRDLKHYLHPHNPACIAMAMQRAIADNQLICGLSTGNAFWADFGTPASYLNAHHASNKFEFSHSPLLRDAINKQMQRRTIIESQGVRCSGVISLGENLTFPAETRLHNVIALDNATLTQPVFCSTAILGIDGETEPPAIHIERLPHPTVYDTLGVTPETCELTPLRKQASGRLYYRISNGDKSWIWSAYNHDREENAVFATITDFLNRIDIQIGRAHV